VRLELTRRADYGVRAMLALAQHHGDEPLSAARIAQTMAIPPRFVGQVMGDLVAAGFVDSRTGRSGGYRLRRPAENISILAIIQATEGDARRRTCVLRNAPCSRDGACDVHAIFQAAQDALIERLAGSTLAMASEVVRPTA
jgi:Rrf2 family protein